jgi:hypothetical protein
VIRGFEKRIAGDFRVRCLPAPPGDVEAIYGPFGDMGNCKAVSILVKSFNIPYNKEH